MVSHPFLAPVEKDLALVRVEVVGDVKGTAEVVPKLVVLELRRVRGQGVGVARPGVGVEGGVAVIFVQGAVELLRAALGDHADLGAGRAAVFSGVIRSKDLDFLRGVHVGGAKTRAVGARARSRGAVKRDQVLRVAGAIEIRRPLVEKSAEARQRAAASAGHQPRKADRVAAVELERVNLLPADELLHGG